jgi:DNA-binding transcriptional LysR family regulator
MELTPLRYFMAIAAARHMTRAAQRLGVTQPALSAVVRKLEDEVGTELFHRTARGVELTEAGRLFLEHAQDAVRRADAGVQAVRELMGLERGSIRIGGGATAAAYLLPPVLSAFRRANPKVRFFIREAGSAAVAEAVLSGELDLGLVTLPSSVAGADDLRATPLVRDELRLIVPARHALASQKTFRWRDIAVDPVVAFEAGSAVRSLLDLESARAGVTLNIVMELRSIDSIKQMVKAGIGVGFVSRFALAGAEGLACRDGRLGRDLAIVRRADRVPSPAVAALERTLVGMAKDL